MLDKTFNYPDQTFVTSGLGTGQLIQSFVTSLLLSDRFPSSSVVRFQSNVLR